MVVTPAGPSATEVANFVSRLRDEHQIANPKDWYKVKRSTVHASGGGKILDKFDGSLSTLLNSVHPEHNWHEWLFSSVSPSYWKDSKNRRAFMEWFMQERGITSLDQWYDINYADVKQAKGGSILKFYNESLCQALRATFPEHEWVEWKFHHVPNRFWEKLENQRQFLDWLGQQLNLASKSGWYNVERQVIVENGGSALLTDYYGHSVAAMLQTVFPEHEWHEWKFKVVPQGFWRDVSNQRRYFLWLEKEWKFKSREDWYHVTKTEFTQKGATGLIHHVYGGSLRDALKAVFPEHEWNPLGFDAVARGHWSSLENQREFFDHVSTKLNIRELSDWYQVSTMDVVRQGGSSLMRRYYRSSLPTALQAIYPDHEWDLLKFRFSPRPASRTATEQVSPVAQEGVENDISARIEYDGNDKDGFGETAKVDDRPQRPKLNTEQKPDRKPLPPGYWSDPENQRHFFSGAERSLGISSMSDWYRVTYTDVERLGGAPLLVHHYEASLSKALRAVYPEHEWREWLFKVVPTNFFQDSDNQRAFIAWFEKEQGINSLEKWYQVNPKLIQTNGGWSLFSQYNNSLVSMLRAMYPTHKWLQWKFANVPKGTWRDPAILREFCLQLAESRNISDFNDWYGVGFAELAKGQAGGLSKAFTSLYAVLKVAFPEHEWLPWKFRKTPRTWWTRPQNRREYFDWLGKQLNFTEYNDWYRLSAADLATHDGTSMLSKYYSSSIPVAVQSVFREHNWDKFKFASRSSRASNEPRDQ